jgi:hypothetical protein
MRSFLLDGTSGLTRVDAVGGDLIVRDGGRLMFARDFTDCEAASQSGGVGCPFFTNPEHWLPATAWEDPTLRPFIPHAYELCLTDKVSGVLPPRAADIFLASPQRDGMATGDCRAVATSDLTTLVEAFEEAGAVVSNADQQPFSGHLPTLGGDGFWIEPILPHGRIYCTGCG